MKILCAALLIAVPAAGAPPAKGSPAAAPIFDTEASGVKQIEATGKTSFTSGRRMIVVFGTNDCPLCRTVNAAIYEPKFNDALMRQFVPVFVDVTPGSENAQLLAKYGIDPAKGLPAVVVADLKKPSFDITKNGEMVAVASRGVAAVQDWFLARFQKSEE